ncbi:lysM and putative peptidoglycan-binding domain-containing protein 1 [Drosophila hydei]|uniref:LysM and putative peptidoglycan-binding domain-containing protein 1 n=1 Tax=Drosophila hydei TaxID=7224 RepID=A0A6J1M0Z2_DROHY|nr:lysM and putative peptidoglycan-binding domain-containing protein 1 [Drosophila hydei]
MATEQAPNLCGQQLGEWTRHQVCSDDTLARLALKYGTTMGRICRANRMYWPDVLQTRDYVWVPAAGKQSEQQQQSESTVTAAVALPHRGRVSIVPPHFYRQSAPNADDFAGDCDPLLITMRCM